MHADDVITCLLPERKPNRMSEGELVASISDHKERVGALNAAAGKTEKIQGGLVRPMEILENHNRRACRLRQILQESSKQRRRKFICPLRDVAGRGEQGRDFMHWSYRPLRGTERITDAPGNLRLLEVLRGKLRNDRT